MHHSLADLVPAFLAGLSLGAALIVAIGAQNAFVLRQGARDEHVGTVVLFCAAADAVLIAAGVLGMGRVLAAWPALATALAWGGAAFLAVYGMRALARALRPGSLQAPGATAPASRRAVLAQAAAFTLLNPHVYLDTVLLVGSVGAQQPPALRPAFVAGGAAASALWFTALGYGARRVGPWLAQPRVWRWIELAIGATMLWLAVGLVRLALLTSGR
jgi:L-lysine exporter family protein LysE/ArgO